MTAKLDTNSSQRRIELSGKTIDYLLRRSSRRSIGLQISAGGLCITAPNRVTLGEIEHAIRAKEHWILSKLQQAANQAPPPALSFGDGMQLPYLGSLLTVRIFALRVGHAEFDPDNNELLLYLPLGGNEAQLQQHLKHWLQQQAIRRFTERVQEFAAKLGVSYQTIVLSNAKTHWGSCSHDGVIRLNWRLIHLAPDLIDYVIAHELAHRREMNHSPRFWATVAQVFPHYRIAKEQLRTATRALPQWR